MKGKVYVFIINTVQDNRMYEPLVSIIIPVYNGSDYLSEAIDSALVQTYNKIEIIVVNDGSDDNGATEKIALSYGDMINYFYKENGGVSTALNFGIAKMKGEWFSWLSHDDIYMPDKIKSGIDEINDKKLDKENTIVSCNSSLMNANGEKVFRPKKFQSGYFSGREMYKNLFNGKNLNGCALLIPKKTLTEDGEFSIEYKYIQDLDYWVNQAYQGRYFYLYNKELVKTRVHKNQGQKKLVNLYPKENLNFLNNLLEKYSTNVVENSYYLKIILFYRCTKIKDKKIRNKFIIQLKKNNQFTKIDYIKYTYFLLRGQVISMFKNVYRSIVNKKFRGA